MNKKLFSINSTNSCKGVALILLLWHHLFNTHPEFGFITYNIAIGSKVCVAIFVILSGYGFSESVKLKMVGLIGFYQKRLITLYFNYWFIAFIFVSIGILFMDRGLQDVFTSYPYTKFLIQMTGLHRFFYSEYGYNATWWYMSVIIPFTLLFPFMYVLIKKYGVLVLIFFLMLLIPNNLFFSEIITLLLPFALGIYLSQKNYINTLSNSLNIFGNWRFTILAAAIAIAAISRIYTPLLKGNWLLGFLLILLVFELTFSFQSVGQMLGFLGEHLFNIFLFHTFIFSYYWKNFIYSFNNPILIFVVLLIICIAISLTIEQLKRLLSFNKLIRKASNLQIPSQIEIPFNWKMMDS